jgi:carboxyl-terminal processing protease
MVLVYKRMTQRFELISGGPAWRGKRVRSWRFNYESCSRQKQAVDVVGMRLDDVRKLKDQRF